jgi:type I restriction enzyme S subunit
MKKPLFERMAVGSTIKTIGLPFFKKLRIILPPLPEQQKIAEVLGVWDRAIATTTALLANARAQKRALMQTLLTGHRRFPGFEDQPWREVRLGDETEVIVSNIDKKSDESDRPVRLCNYTDVYKNDTITRTMPFMEATATAAQIERFGLKVGDVIITKDSETPDDIAVPAYVAETADDLVCGYHLAIIRPGPMADGRYLKFLFELPHTKYYFGTRANGATRFGLKIDGIRDAMFQLPSPAEQHHIANALNDSEAEIGSHVQTLDRLRTEKKALMQQLLTGQRRVVV